MKKKTKQPLNLNIAKEILAIIERDLTDKFGNLKQLILENKTVRDGRFIMENNMDYARGAKAGVDNCLDVLYSVHERIAKIQREST